MDSDRIYQHNDDQWYFNVRGNQAMGPYATHLDASTALDKHVGACHRRVAPERFSFSLRNPLKPRPPRQTGQDTAEQVATRN